MNEYDVVVVGGGIAGTMAAVAAGRAGARCLVVEQYGFLGGMLTVSGVGPMMTFHAGEKQVVQGLTGELIDRLVARGKSPGHIFDTTGYTYTVTPFDAEAMKHELELLVLENSGEILYHTMLAAAGATGPRLEAITVCNKGGLSRLEGRVFVDATGDGDLAAWAGVECRKGRDSDGLDQPMTMNLRVRNVDIERVKQYIKAHPEEFPRLKGDTSMVDKAPRLSIGGFVQTLRKAREEGEISFKREDLLFFETNTPGEVIVNTSRIVGHDATDPWSLSRAETEGREQVRELERFLTRRVAGFEQAQLVYSGPRVGVRSSRRVVGLYTLTKEDLLAGRRFDDTIAYSGYPIDVHPPEGERSSEEIRRRTEEDKFHEKRGHVASIPYRCLVNDQVDNLITVGRCISTTFEANGAIRTTPIVGAIGHAGGAAAAIAATEGLAFKDIDVRKVQGVLRQQNAYLEMPAPV
jgi:hypothetical protein